MSPAIIDRIGSRIGAYASDIDPPPLGIGRRIVQAFMGLFLAAIFGGMFAWVVAAFVQCQASRQWPSVAGEVRSAGVEEKHTRTSRGGTRVEYSARVEYEYTVGGQQHVGTQVGFGPHANFSFQARALAEQYHPQQKVTVYYDPTNPKEAVLRREVLFGGYVGGLVGLFASFCGLRLLLVALTPTMTSTNSRWLPWSRRFTWPDLPVTIVGVVGLAVWAPMLFGL